MIEVIDNFNMFWCEAHKFVASPPQRNQLCDIPSDSCGSFAKLLGRFPGADQKWWDLHPSLL